MRNITIYLLFLALVSVCYGGYLLESWEEPPDPGIWIDWYSGKPIYPPDPCHGNEYIWPGYVGVTHGNYSLGIVQSGWGNGLVMKLNATQRAAFMEYDKLLIDFSIPAGTTVGWVEIYTVSLNADDGGDGLWVDLDVNKPAAHFDAWDGSPERTMTVSWDYSQYLDDIAADPCFVNLIFAFNSGGGQDTMYVDYLRLCSVSDISGDCGVDFEDLEIMADEWLETGIKADIFQDNFVDFRDFAILADRWFEEQP